MKRMLFILVLLLLGHYQIANAQQPYTKGQILQCQGRTLIISKVLSGRFTYVDANNPYDLHEPATSSNPEFVHEKNYGWQKVDNSRFVKPSRESVIVALREVLGNYYNYMPADPHRSRNQSIGIRIHTDNDGDFVNAWIKISGTEETLRSISADQLNQIYNIAAGMRLGVPAEYQAISDHYFGYCVLFQEL